MSTTAPLRQVVKMKKTSCWIKKGAAELVSRRSGKFKVVMTRDDDTFIPLGDRVKIARGEMAALFVSIHADALAKGGKATHRAPRSIRCLTKHPTRKLKNLQMPKIAWMPSAGVNLTEEPADVADILIDLTQRETRTFSNRFAGCRWAK